MDSVQMRQRTKTNEKQMGALKSEKSIKITVFIMIYKNVIN